MRFHALTHCSAYLLLHSFLVSAISLPHPIFHSFSTLATVTLCCTHYVPRSPCSALTMFRAHYVPIAMLQRDDEGRNAATGDGASPLARYAFNRHRQLMVKHKLPRDPRDGAIKGAMVRRCAASVPHAVPHSHSHSHYSTFHLCSCVTESFLPSSNSLGNYIVDCLTRTLSF